MSIDFRRQSASHEFGYWAGVVFVSLSSLGLILTLLLHDPSQLGAWIVLLFAIAFDAALLAPKVSRRVGETPDATAADDPRHRFKFVAQSGIRKPSESPAEFQMSDDRLQERTMGRKLDAFDNAESVREMPDFNEKELNGRTPKQILKEYGVHVEVLGPWDPAIKARPIVVAGQHEKVRDYIKVLRSTWPSK